MPASERDVALWKESKSFPSNKDGTWFLVQAHKPMKFDSEENVLRNWPSIKKVWPEFYNPSTFTNMEQMRWDAAKNWDKHGGACFVHVIGCEPSSEVESMWLPSLGDAEMCFLLSAVVFPKDPKTQTILDTAKSINAISHGLVFEGRSAYMTYVPLGTTCKA